MRSRLFTLAVVPLISLALAACNKDESNPITPVVPTEKTITDLVVADTRFETLETAVKAAGLAETLAGTGPFTVFAPTNEAFAALPAGTLTALLATPMGDLKNILLYHVVPGSVKAAQVVTLSKATTVFGKDVSIKVMDGKVYLNGTVEVTVTDIAASNGIIHVINAVLLPPKM
jgi:uncharacterized surface protein with fasciclin (FAS1) repeats